MPKVNRKLRRPFFRLWHIRFFGRNFESQGATENFGDLFSLILVYSIFGSNFEMYEVSVFTKAP